jgi:thymidylate synthase (FAD)
MMAVELVWTTVNGDDLIAKMARVSNPDNEDNMETAPKLISYLMKHKHWSPFEMANMCVLIETTRDISRQLLRHRSFSFQEFSQRYAVVPKEPVLREARMQDPKNRQNSVPVKGEEEEYFAERFVMNQKHVWHVARSAYEHALEMGIAKEQARALLPEGLTPTRLYMNGNIRSWLHFIALRGGNGTQKEATGIANAVAEILSSHYPLTWKAYQECATSF